MSHAGMPVHIFEPLYQWVIGSLSVTTGHDAGVFLLPAEQQEASKGHLSGILAD